MRRRVLWQVALTAFRDFVRTPEAVFWTYGFPLLMALALGLAFSGGEPEPLRVAVPRQAEGAAALADVLGRNERLRVETMGRAELERAHAHGEVDLVVGGTVAAPELEVDPARAESELARLHVLDELRTAAGQPRPPARIRAVTAPGSRYIDFLIPGLIGLNLLGAGMYGVGFNLVHLRVRKMLRRLAVTPMRRSEFLLAYVASRLVLVVPESLAIVLFGVLAFGVPLSGSLGLLFALVLLGGLAFSGLGVLVASRARSIEAISGLMNLVMVPMWLLGGSFFASTRFPDFVQPLVKLLPLTHLNDALRAVMLGGDGLAAVGGSALYLLGFAVLCFAAAVRVFRWA